MSSQTRPSTCNTDGCDREPTVKIRRTYHTPFEPGDDWYCQPCENALVVGNALAAGGTEVLDRVD